MSVEALLSEVKRASNISLRNRHRFAVFLCTSEVDEETLALAARVLKAWRKTAGKKDKLLVLGKEEFIDAAKKRFSGAFVAFGEAQRVLGETYEALLIDLTQGFNPNDLGIAVETIAEGGVILALSPQPEAWRSLISWLHEDLAGEAQRSEVVPRFYRRFIEKSMQAAGAIFFDCDAGEVLKGFDLKQTAEKKQKLRLPEESEIKKKLYKLCATQDQVDVLRRFEGFLAGKRKAAVITADRGRGKTALLGILTPYLISVLNRRLKRAVRVLVVAPSPRAVQTYFLFLKKAMIRQGMTDFFVRKKGELVTLINSRYARVEYAVPRRALTEKDYADVIIVDEAAALAVEVLWELTRGEADYLIFSSTIHGYEGAGRGFSIRFLRKFESSGEYEVVKMNLSEPIRYAAGDPVEAWLYDVLLLDAKPAQLTDGDLEAIKAGELSFEPLDRDELYSNDRLLREFFGIYILAHYRNKPSDVLILGDMPKHFAFRVVANGKTVASLHVAEEGEIEDELIAAMAQGYRPKGQIVPDVILKHYCDEEFPKLRGLRIVRIATHPKAMNLGIGSFALRELEKWARERGNAYLAAGFGVSADLLRFWDRNAFVPVHITAQRNEISGEHTLVVIKPLTSSLEERVAEINAEFVNRLIEYLADELRSLNTSVAMLMLRSLQIDAKVPDPSLDSVAKTRLEKYFSNLSYYESIGDIAKPLMRYHFSRARRAELTREEELVVIGKCLQHKGWDELGNAFGTLTRAIRKVWVWYEENKLQS
jgi:tRNA(Met) cytidine acetyltransferase